MIRGKKTAFMLFVVALVAILVLVILGYRTLISSHMRPVVLPATQAPTSQTTTPGQQSAQILGIGPPVQYHGIPWVRLSYPTCGKTAGVAGDALKKEVESDHAQGIHVLLTFCQGPNDTRLTNTDAINAMKDAVRSNPDAVQCGNEEMKQDPSVAFLYISPQNFARFYDLCETIVHKTRADIPVLLGSLDPHVGGVDYQPLTNQVQYLDQMQTAMNSSVHPGGHWEWYNQILGLIDSWHNGYPDANVNSLSGLFSFWAQQFHVNLNSGNLGEHLWVVEGTGCFKGCGLDPGNSSQIAVAHILTLIVDVQTTMRYGVPFFYFSSKDFSDQNTFWPIGILDVHGNPKPIRQDLPMGARALNLSCPSGNIVAVNQEQLLAGLYSHCSLPANYLSIIER